MSEQRIVLSLLDREFQVSCPSEVEATLREAASYLNQQLETARLRTRTQTNERLLLMTALNIAHELILLRSGDNLELDSLSTRIARLQEKLESALQDPLPIR